MGRNLKNFNLQGVGKTLFSIFGQIPGFQGH